MANQYEHLSIRQAAKELGVNRFWLSGYLWGLGLLTPVGPSLMVRRKDLKRVKKSKEAVA